MEEFGVKLLEILSTTPGMAAGVLRRRVLCPLALLLSSGFASADSTAWVAPKMIPDNPAFQTANLGKPYASGLQVFVFGGSMEGAFKSAPNEFWEGIIRADSDNVVGAAQEINANGMSYHPFFSVLFPTEEGVALVRESFPERLSDWGDANRRVWHGTYPYQGRSVVYRIFFKVHPEDGDPGMCHSRQVIRILYTGEADEAELADCISMERKP